MPNTLFTSATQLERLYELLSFSLKERSMLCVHKIMLYLQGMLEFRAGVVAEISEDAETIQNILPLDVPREWMKTYVSQRFQKVDPVVAYGQGFNLPYDWRDAAISRSYVDPYFITAALDFGMADGYAHLLPGFGNRVIFSLANTNHRDDTLIALGIVTPVIVSILGTRTNKPEPVSNEIKLTPRERDVLTWASYGKSAWEIGAILSVSERTVKFHLANIYQKLGVINRSQAISKALERDLL